MPSISAEGLLIAGIAGIILSENSASRNLIPAINSVTIIYLTETYGYCCSHEPDAATILCKLATWKYSSGSHIWLVRCRVASNMICLPLLKWHAGNPMVQ